MRTLPTKNDGPSIKEKVSSLESERDQYKALAEAREFTMDTILKPSMEILTVKGIVMTMIGEVTSYGIKQGRNERYQLSMDRLMQIMDFLEGCNKVNDHNYQLRMMLNNSIKKRDDLQQANEKLEAQLEAINQAWNAE